MQNTTSGRSRFVIHKCSFVDWKAYSITATAFSFSCKHLAVARSNGSIEVWNVEHEWFLELIIPGEGPDFSARSLIWVPTFDPEKGIPRNVDQQPERLFSAGLTGEITEWDLSTLKPKDKTIVGAGGIWNMNGILARFTSESDETPEWQFRFCVGCEDGRVRIFRMTPSGPCVLHSTSLRHPSRVLCVAWHPNGKLVCGGDADGNIRVFEADNCKQKYRMTTTTSSESPTRVWTVLILPEGTIVSGNSMGNTEFWDSNLGVQTQSLSTHSHDITCMSATRNPFEVLVAGINTRVVRVYKAANRWVMEKGKRLHSHDVATMAIAHRGRVDWMVSGGLDTLLIRQSVDLQDPERPDTLTFRMDPFPHYPVFSVCKNPLPILMSHCETQIQLWALGKPKKEAEGFQMQLNFTELSLDESLRQLLQLDLRTSSPIYCSAISPKGNYMAVSDTHRLFVFSVTYDLSINKVGVKKVNLPNIPSKGVIRIVFTVNQLILATNKGSVVVVDLSSKECTVFDQHQYDNRGSIHLLCVSDDGQWLASSDTKNHIQVYNLDVMKHYITLPNFPALVTAMCFSPIEPVVTLVCSNSYIYQYNVEMKDLTAWSKRNSDTLPVHFETEKGVITNISYNPANPAVCFLSSPTFLCKIDFTKSVDLNTTIRRFKKRCRDGEDKVNRTQPLPKNFAMIYNYAPTLFASFVDSNELVVVQRQRSEYVKELPAPVNSRKVRAVPPTRRRPR